METWLIPLIAGLAVTVVAVWGVRQRGLVREARAAGDEAREELDATRKQAEDDAEHRAQLEAQLEGTIDAVVVFDESGRIVRANRAADRLFGWPPGELAGQELAVLVPDPHRSLTQAYLEEYLETGRSEILGLPRDAIAVRRDGSELPIGVAISEYWVGGRRFFVGVARNISERKRAEQDLLLAQRSAEELARVKSEFLATMSHEIRTPMNGVLGMVTLLRDTPLDDEQTDFVDTIRASALSLLDILNDILDFSKNDAGRLELECVPLDLERACHDVVRLLGPKAIEKGLDLDLLWHPETPRFVRGDPTRIRQVLVNLVSNAIKFTAQGHVAIDVHANEGGGIELQVRDTGVGIPEEAQDKLFQPFAQADRSITRHFGGTGLGLAICKQLVTAMGGEIGLESTPDVGTTFHVSLPLVPDSRTMDRPAALAGKRCVVVSTSPVHRTALQLRLERLGLDVEALGVEELRQRAATFDEAGGPEIVVVEHVPLELDAEEWRARLSSASPPVPLVALLPPGQSGGPEGALAGPTFVDTLKDALLVGLGQARTETARSEAEVAHVQLSGHVLLAEDNVVNQRVAAKTLEKLGLEVTIVDDGQAAVDAVARGGLDVVLMDCQMPVLDGLEATRAIRRAEAETGAHLPIVALTANALGRDRQRCLDAGMDDYLSKPFARPDLVRVLAKWLSPEGASADS